MPLLPAAASEDSGPATGEGAWRRASRDERITALFEENYRELCRLAALLLRDPHGAEEVVQEAFLKTFAGWRRIRHPERAQFYLRAGVVNLCRTRLRRRTTEDRGNRTTWAGDEARSPGMEPGQHAERLVVLAAVQALPERQREAVILRYYLDLSEAEMASVLGCAPGTVKSQLSKARANLARQLEDDRDPVRDDPGSVGDVGSGAASGGVGA